MEKRRWTKIGVLAAALMVVALPVMATHLGQKSVDDSAVCGGPVWGDLRGTGDAHGWQTHVHDNQSKPYSHSGIWATRVSGWGAHAAGTTQWASLTGGNHTGGTGSITTTCPGIPYY